MIWQPVKTGFRVLFVVVTLAAIFVGGHRLDDAVSANRAALVQGCHDYNTLARIQKDVLTDALAPPDKPRFDPSIVARLADPVLRDELIPALAVPSSVNLRLIIDRDRIVLRMCHKL